MLNSVRESVASTVASRVGLAPKQVEVEVKFGSFIPDFKSSVPYVHYQRVADKLRSLSVAANEMELKNPGSVVSKWVMTQEQSTVLSQNDGLGKRIRHIRAATEYWEIKSIISAPNTSAGRIGHFDIREYDIRLSISTEERITARPNFKPDVQRERMRTSFIHPSGKVRVDVSEIVSYNITTTGQLVPAGNTINLGEEAIEPSSYEVEVELLDINSFDILEQVVNLIFTTLKDTRLIYTTAVKAALISDINAGLNSNFQGSIDRSSLVEARNVKMRDLVFGGIVGNPNYSYAVSYKADGLRKMLIIHRTGIWLVYPPFEYNLIMPLDAPGLPADLIKSSGTVIDGELVIPRPGTVKNPYWFIPFDCILFNNSSEIQNLDFFDRKKIADSRAGFVNVNPLSISNKLVVSVDTPQRFFSEVTALLAGCDRQEYLDDGLIFTPISVKKDFLDKIVYSNRNRPTAYNPHSERFPLKQRTAVYHPDVLKWKEVITIDFAIRKLANGTIQLYSSIGPGNTQLFVGSDINPVTPDMLPVDDNVTRKLDTGKVVEFKWVVSKNEDFPLVVDKVGDQPTVARGRFKAVKSREDKLSPNRLEVALDDWEDINRPITAADISGQTLTLTFEEAKRAKKNLLRLLPDNSVILDIGTGRGGDLNRFPRNSVIIAVEPNAENLTELNKRIVSLRMGNRVLVLPTNGEDTATITAAVKTVSPVGVDAVTLMLSMSFFWATSQHLDALVATIRNTLKPGGKILFVTIDGDTVAQMFEPVFSSPTVWRDRINFNGGKLRLYPSVQSSQFKRGRPLYIQLPQTTIVGDQLEYLVFLEDFSSRLGSNFTLTTRYRLDQKLLTKGARSFLDLYSAGIFSGKESSLTAKAPLLTLNNIPLPPSITLADLEPINQNLTQQNIQSSTAMLATNSAIVGQTIPPAVSQVIVPPVVSQVIVPPAVSQIARPIITPTVSQVIVPPALNFGFPPALNFGFPPLLKQQELSLPSLPVNASTGMGDDMSAPLQIDWYKPQTGHMVRIATLGDGNCFIHALLKGFYAGYQNNPSITERRQLAQKLRLELALLLAYENPDYPGHSFWESTGEGAFPRLLMQQLQDQTLVQDIGVDFSLYGLQRLFNSANTLGNEVYKFAADALKIDIYVFQATLTTLIPHLSTYRPGRNRPAVVIIGNKVHYEVVGFDNNTNIQTVFSAGDPFLTAIMKTTEETADNGPYDPDESFTVDVVNAFNTPQGLTIPADLVGILGNKDPFIGALRRNSARIIELARNIGAVPFSAKITLVNNGAGKEFQQVEVAGPVIDPVTPTVRQFSKIPRLNAAIIRAQGLGIIQDEELDAIITVVQARMDIGSKANLEKIINDAASDGQLTPQVALFFNEILASVPT